MNDAPERACLEMAGVSAYSPYLEGYEPYLEGFELVRTHAILSELTS